MNLKSKIAAVALAATAALTSNSAPAEAATNTTNLTYSRSCYTTITGYSTYTRVEWNCVGTATLTLRVNAPAGTAVWTQSGSNFDIVTTSRLLVYPGNTFTQTENGRTYGPFTLK
jgi:hypothetical protein